MWLVQGGLSWGDCDTNGVGIDDEDDCVGGCLRFLGGDGDGEGGGDCFGWTFSRCSGGSSGPGPGTGSIGGGPIRLYFSGCGSRSIFRKAVSVGIDIMIVHDDAVTSSLTSHVASSCHIYPSSFFIVLVYGVILVVVLMS